MEKTRQIALEFRETTGQSLPITSELARYDIARLLELQLPDETSQQTDILTGDKQFLVKGRVIFDPTKSGYKVGSVNMNIDWASMLLILYNNLYQPESIYDISRIALIEHFESQTKKQKPSLSIAKCKAIGQQVWSN